MKCHVWGGTAKFRAFLRGLCGEGDEFTVSRDLEELLSCSGPDHVCFLLPDYEAGARSIPCRSTAWINAVRSLIASGTRLYVENYAARDYLHAELMQAQVMGNFRHLFQEYIVRDGGILQSRDGFFFPGVKRGGRLEALLTDCVGTNRVVREGSYAFPVLLKNAEGTLLSSLTDLSRFDPLFRRPYGRWERLFEELFSGLTGVPPERCRAAFEKVFPDPVALSPGNTPEQLVRRALEWHVRAGLLPAPDGKAGMFEMIQSADLTLRRNLRTDSTLLTGAFFATAGTFLHEERLVRTGCALADFLLDRGIQRPDGLCKWMDNTPSVWASDCGRDGLALWQLHKVTKERRYRDAAFRLADGLLAWLAADGLCCGTFSGPCIPAGAKSTDNPVFYGEMAAFLFQLGEEKYTRAALRALRRIGEKFPQVAPFGFSGNFTFSRRLLMLSAAQYHSGEDFSGEINDSLAFFAALQEPCGGVRETPIRLEKHPEAGIAMGDGSDCIADLLYCNNFVLNALSILRNLPPARRGRIDCGTVEKMYGKLRSFWLERQISSPDPRLDGGWMRAFDMGSGEYYGFDKDLDWGAYCIMAGWVMGFVPMVFLEERGARSFFF